MLIDCPDCARSYHVSRPELEGGRVVICPRCDARWFVGGDGRARPCEPSSDDLSATGVSSRTDSAARVAVAEMRPSLFRGARPLASTAACLTLLMLLIGARERVVSMVPRTAGLYAMLGLSVNVRGLEFTKVMPARLDPSSPEVIIAGEIRNVSARRVRVPLVSYEIRDAGGEPLMSWSEKASAPMLGAGGVLAFASASRQLPPESRTVLVRFGTGDRAAVHSDRPLHPTMTLHRTPPGKI